MRQLEGNRSRTPIPRDLPGVGKPVPPAHLTPEQRERWEDVVASLPEPLLSRADVQVLERMAIAWAAYRQTTLLINQSGLITRGANGEPVRNPLLFIRQSASHEMHECGERLGLSPLARTRLTTPENVEDDPMDILLGPHGKAWGDEHFPVKN
jgi:P27 family predicted phage terminase small subunit